MDKPPLHRMQALILKGKIAYAGSKTGGDRRGDSVLRERASSVCNANETRSSHHSLDAINPIGSCGEIGGGLSCREGWQAEAASESPGRPGVRAKEAGGLALASLRSHRIPPMSHPI